MLELNEGLMRPAAIELASALAATITTVEATDWRAVLHRIEHWEATLQLPLATPRPGLRLRQLLDGEGFCG